MDYATGYRLLTAVWLVAAGGAAALLLARERGRVLPGGAWLPLLLAAAVAPLLWLYSEPRPHQLFEDLRVAYLGAAQAIFDDPVGLYRSHNHGFVNIPIVALPFVPLAAAGGAAPWLFTLAGLAAAGWAAFALSRLGSVGRPTAPWIPALFLLCGPLYNSLREGNTTHLLLALLVLALLCLERGREATAGALLGICGVVKLPLFLLGAPLLLRGRARAALAMAAAATGCALLSVALFGWEAHTTWWNEILRPSSGKPLGAFNVQSLDGMWVRLLTGPRHLRDWQPIAEPGGAFFALRYAASLALLAATLFWLGRAGAPRSPRALRHELVITLALAMLLSPISWSHYALWLLIPLALFATGDLPRPTGLAAALLGIAALAVLAPVQLVPPGPGWLREAWARVFVSHAALGTLLLWGLLVAARAQGTDDLRR